MFTEAFTFSLLSLAARAALTPVAPGPGDIFPAGSQCSMGWTPDSTGTWTNVTIQLMSGQNLDMTPVALVAQGLDGTNPALTPYNWTCPEVDPYSAIYFYQFSQEGADSPAWTTRFAISSPDGTVVPPEYATQSSGDAVPWGTGQLAFSALSNTSVSNDTLTLPAMAANQSGMVRVIQPTMTTVLTWVEMPLQTGGPNGSAMGMPEMAELASLAQRGHRSGIAAAAALALAAGVALSIA